jgi:hypothetical protein
LQTLAAGKVAVAFKDPVTDEKTAIEFRLARVGREWKIADIIYGQKKPPSRRKILSRNTRRLSPLARLKGQRHRKARRPSGLLTGFRVGRH